MSDNRIKIIKEEIEKLQSFVSQCAYQYDDCECVDLDSKIAANVYNKLNDLIDSIDNKEAVSQDDFQF